MHSPLCAVLSRRVTIWKQPIPIYRWMGNENIVFTHPGILLNLKKGNPAVCVDGSVGHYLREINQVQKRKLFHNIYVWNLKNPRIMEQNGRCRDLQRKDGEMRHTGTKASVGQDASVLRSIVQYGGCHWQQRVLHVKVITRTDCQCSGRLNRG